MTPKALAQLRRDTTQAQHHLALLERCLSTGETRVGAVLLATPSMVEHARKTVANMEQLIADNTPQLSLFSLPTP